MSTEKKPINEQEEELIGGFSRREFLKSAGFVVGGATLGSMSILAACQGGATSTVTKTNTLTTTNTVTTTVGAGQTATVTAPGTTVTVTQTPGSPVPAVEGLVHLIVNGVDYWGKVEPEWTLAYVLREKLALTGTKRGCKSGDCGVCTVIMDGRAVLSCCILACEADGKQIETVEGLMQNGVMHPLQTAFIEEDALQCGFCTPGMLMTGKALLTLKPKPTVAEIKEFMAGTICRCGANANIITAIQKVAG
jgi:aerobic-type carbon monoxide dehydrogenase small subunit (CoxS/CutS family)